MPGTASFHVGFSYEKGGEKTTTLQAPSPAAGVIQTTANSAQSFTSRPSRPAPPAIQTLSPERVHENNNETKGNPLSSSHSSRFANRRQSVGSYFAALPEMVFCFCCCPVYRCALWGCMFELVVSLFCWYKILGIVLGTINHLDIKDGILIFILTFWIITLFTSFGMLVASHKRKNASYVLPRLIQQAGLLIISLLTGCLLFFYFFGGGNQVINGWLMTLYKFFLDNKVTAEDEREIGREVQIFALVAVPIDFFFICYFACGLFITKRYYNHMKSKYGSGFHPVSQNELEPSAPQPSSNPYYKEPVY
ncbi:hypothetical protein M3Y94_00230400 [Aphelenchoides besseyi]|nr:hypothetical protein M3Y94_00230400 [Aphelenchoides besseyi]KAI6236445.1 hypothetical protein M3Y95_00158400 [Aphelenchoides besseyi]